MAGYIPQIGQQAQSQYSLIDLPQFQTAYSQTPAQAVPAQEGGSFLSPDVAKAAAYGAQSGGVSGALISGGTTSLLTSGAAAGGPYAIAGGLILSQIEAAQKAKAAHEQEVIANEKERMSKTQQAYASMANQRFGV